MTFSIALASDPSYAKDPLTEIEEITVTARKREETLQDVPISVSTMTATEMKAYGVDDLTDLSVMLHNVEVDYGSRSGLLSIRGVGRSSAQDAGFDQAVGLVMDEVYYTRSRWVQASNLDLQQVDVLRGPQGLYTGKNTIAGALILRSANPSDEREGWVKLSNEFVGEEITAEAVLSTPLSETLGARLAVRALNLHGWAQNRQVGHDSPDREEQYGRLTLRWDPTDAFDSTFKLFYGHFDRWAAHDLELHDCPAGGVPQPPFGFIPVFPDDCKANHKYRRDYTKSVDHGRTPFWEFDAVALSNVAHWQVNESIQATSVSAFNRYRTVWTENWSYAADIIFAYEKETNDTLSQELRLLTDWDGPFNLLLGGYYEYTSFHFTQTSQLFDDRFFAALGLPGFLCADGTCDGLDEATGGRFTWYRPSRQRGMSWAGFAEVIWDISDAWELAAGLRYTHEEKDSHSRNRWTNPEHDLVFGQSQLSYDDDFDDDDLSPQVTLTWRPNDTLMLWASYKEGFKAGGFAHGTTLNAGFTISDVTFESEEVYGYEVGIKSSLFDDTVRLSLAGYWYEFSDLQVNTFDAETFSFRVGNAGKNIVQGVELDGIWRMTDEFWLDFALAYNDSEVDDFDGQCFQGQTIEQGCNRNFNPGTGAFTSQDLSDVDLAGTPNWEYSLGANWSHPLQNGMILSANARVKFVDRYTLDVLADELFEQEPYFRIDAGVSLFADPWQVAFYGRNLTNERIMTSSGGNPGTGGTAGYSETDPRCCQLADRGASLARGPELGVSVMYRFFGP